MSRARDRRMNRYYRSQYRMKDGDTIDGSFEVGPSNDGGGCHNGYGWRGRRGRSPIRIGILLIVLGTIAWHMSDNQGVEAGGWRHGPIAPIAAVNSGVNQQYFEDVTVRDGETIRGDLVNYSGNVRIEDGGTVRGDLVLFSGNAIIEEGGEVEGDVTVWSGDVTVRGDVGGDIAAMSGSVVLADSASVDGDVSTFSGSVTRDSGASVDGDVVSGVAKGVPFLGTGVLDSLSAIAPVPPIAPVAPVAPEAPAPFIAAAVKTDRQPSWPERILFMIGRLILAALVTFAVTALSIGVFSIRPASMQASYERMRGSMRGSFALGAVISFGLWLGSMALFRVGICFTPVALVAMLTLILLTVVGYGLTSRTVGVRVLDAFNRSTVERRPVMEVAAGVFVVTAVLGLVSAITAQSWIFWVASVLIAAPGVGAIAKPIFDKVRNRKVMDLTSPGQQPVTAAATAGASASASAGTAATVPASAFGTRYPMGSSSSVTATASAPVKPYAPNRPVAPSPFGTTDSASSLTVQDIPVQKAPLTPTSGTDLSAVEGATASAAPAETDSAWLLEAPKSSQPSSAYSLTLPEAPAIASANTPGVTVEDLVNAADAERAAVDAQRAAEEVARERAVDVSIGDDLTQIIGLGKSSERKLKGAGIVTYAQLAAVPVEMIAAILGVPAEEVIEDEIVKQASSLTGKA